MKYAITTFLIAIFSMNFAIAQDKLFSDGLYTLKHSEIRIIKGERYKDTFWIRSDGKTKIILCRIPKNCKDIDIKSLTEGCLIKTEL